METQELDQMQAGLFHWLELRVRRDYISRGLRESILAFAVCVSVVNDWEVSARQEKQEKNSLEN